MNPTLGLGGRPREVRTTDYPVEAFMGSASPTPASYSTPVSKIYMQSRFGTCGAHAGAALANAIFGGTTSPKFLWKIIKSIDGFGLNDGTTMDAIFKALKTCGICSYDLMPNPTEIEEYPADLTIEQYSDINEITEAQRTDALTRMIGSYAFTNNPTIQQIKDAVYQHKAAILLVDCGTGWYVPDWLRKDVIPLHIGTLVGRHFITVTQFGMTITEIDGPNSWSFTWADDGMFGFNADYLPHVLEMGIAIPPATPVTPTPAMYKFTQTMMYGQTSADVHALQVKLGVNPTGFYGVVTIMAVAKFQAAHGIFPTGFVWYSTLAVLNT